MTTTKAMTFIIPAALDQHVEMYCAATGRLKKQIATAALDKGRWKAFTDFREPEHLSLQ